MAQYTDNQLLAAIQAHMVQDSSYRKELERAVSSKSRNRLGDLIAKAAKWFFGSVIKGVVNAVIKHFFPFW